VNLFARAGNFGILGHAIRFFKTELLYTRKVITVDQRQTLKNASSSNVSTFWDEVTSR
jgi:hypothetical protein